MSKTLTLWSLCCLALVFSCQRPDLAPVIGSGSKNETTISIDEARQWFEQRSSTSMPGAAARLGGNKSPKFTKKPMWKQAKTVKTSKGDAVAVRFERDEKAVVGRIRGEKKVEQLSPDNDPIGMDELSVMLLYKKG